MGVYFSTFPAGAESIVEKALQKSDSAVSVRDKYSGLVIYESNLQAHGVQQIRFFNNSFSLLYEIKGSPNLREALNKLRTDEFFINKLRKALPKKAKTFKIIASIENQNVAMSLIQLKKLEAYITKETKLSLPKKYPDVEIWIVQRREDLTLVGLRLTYPDPNISKPERGELSVQMANILCLASEPSPEDIVLDPFAGYGGIVFERATTFPHKKITALERDSTLVKKMRDHTKALGKNILIEQGDARQLKLPDASVNVVITDPPWGIYEKENISELYLKMLAEFQRVLVRKGRLVVLTGAKEDLEKTLKQTSDLRIIEKTDILVSGKKAAIYKIVKV